MRNKWLATSRIAIVLLELSFELKGAFVTQLECKADVSRIKSFVTANDNELKLESTCCGITCHCSCAHGQGLPCLNFVWRRGLLVNTMENDPLASFMF